MNSFKFANHPGVPQTPPETSVTNRLDKAFTDEPLTPEDAYAITDILYGIGSNSDSDYRLLGWAWPMANAQQMKRILVATADRPDVFRTYYAPNKTVLRQILKGNGPRIVEMIAVKK